MKFVGAYGTNRPETRPMILASRHIGTSERELALTSFDTSADHAVFKSYPNSHGGYWVVDVARADDGTTVQRRRYFSDAQDNVLVAEVHNEGGQGLGVRTVVDYSLSKDKSVAVPKGYRVGHYSSESDSRFNLTLARYRPEEKPLLKIQIGIGTVQEIRDFNEQRVKDRKLGVIVPNTFPGVSIEFDSDEEKFSVSDQRIRKIIHQGEVGGPRFKLPESSYAFDVSKADGLLVVTRVDERGWLDWKTISPGLPYATKNVVEALDRVMRDDSSRFTQIAAYNPAALQIG